MTKDTQKANLNLRKAKPTVSLRTAHMCVRITVHSCRIQYSTLSSDIFHSYPPDNHRCSDVVYCREGKASEELLCYMLYFLLPLLRSGTTFHFLLKVFHLSSILNVTSELLL